MSPSNEQLAIRFVELLVDRATRSGQSVWRWATMTPAWRRVFIETVPAFLDEISRQSIPVGVDERREDEQIRQLPVASTVSNRGARVCVVCGRSKPGSHFRIRPLKGAGYRVVRGY